MTDPLPPGTARSFAAGAAAVVETHSAIRFFAGDLVYKLKKPVDLDFLDFRYASRWRPSAMAVT